MDAAGATSVATGDMISAPPAMLRIVSRTRSLDRSRKNTRKLVTKTTVKSNLLYPEWGENWRRILDKVSRMSDQIFYTKSRVSGKNADVHIFNNRVEWSLAPRGSGWNITAVVVAIFTVGISLIWFRPSFKSQATEMIPASRISSVQTKKDGPVNTKVTVVTSGNTIEFRTGHDKAQQIQQALTGLATA